MVVVGEPCQCMCKSQRKPELKIAKVEQEHLFIHYHMLKSSQMHMHMNELLEYLLSYTVA